MPHDFKHTIKRTASPVNLFRFFVITSLSILNIHSDGAGIAGIARWSFAIFATIG